MSHNSPNSYKGSKVLEMLFKLTLGRYVNHVGDNTVLQNVSWAR